MSGACEKCREQSEEKLLDFVIQKRFLVRGRTRLHRWQTYALERFWSGTGAAFQVMLRFQVI